MMSEQILDIAKAIASVAHKNQKRFDGLPYITHLEAVANLVIGHKLKTIAWLHDVIEDSSYTGVRLKEILIPTDIVCSVIAMSRREGEEYLNFIQRISLNKNAIIVKLADISHNLSNLKKGSMRDKYIMAKFMLNEKLKEFDK